MRLPDGFSDVKTLQKQNLGTYTWNSTFFCAAKMKLCLGCERLLLGFLKQGTRCVPAIVFISCFALSSFFSCFLCPRIPGGDTFLLYTQLDAQEKFPTSSPIPMTSCCFYKGLKTLSYTLTKGISWMLLENQKTPSGPTEIMLSFSSSM